MGDKSLRHRRKQASQPRSPDKMVPKIATDVNAHRDALMSHVAGEHRIPNLARRRSTEGSDSDIIMDDFVMVRENQRHEALELDHLVKEPLQSEHSSSSGDGDDDDGKENEDDSLLPRTTILKPRLNGSLSEVEEENQAKETSFTVALQVFFPFLIAGFGTVLAGLLLDVVQHWVVFMKVKELFILVPALLGLKGNLEMTLASRLSTAANTGAMDCKQTLQSLVVGNIVLTQAQALVVAALASVAAVTFQYISNGEVHFYYANLLCASSLLTASLASLLLGIAMVIIIVLSHRCGINPDNVATPIAASMGDLVTLALLSYISSFLFSVIGTHHWIAPIISVCSLILLPLWLYIAHHNTFTHNVLYTGWTPVIVAMCLSSGGGLILRFAVDNLPGIAVFNPVVNGVGGNLVAVQASRLSTALHKSSVLGHLPDGVKYGCISTFCLGGGHSRTARVLLFMSLPGHLIFLFLITWVKAGHTSSTPIFIVSYLIVGALQVGILLFTANWLVHWTWKRGNDPDNFCIPYLTALGDLLGTALLAVAFRLLWLVGDRDTDVGD